MRTLPLASAIVVAVVFAAAKAGADDRAIAEQVFQQARDLMAQGNVAEACPKFAAAAKLSQTAGVRLNLAECYARLGKTASAWAQAHDALTIAERAGDPAAAELARVQMAGLEPKLSYLTIVVAGTAGSRGMEVALDGEAIPDAAWGTPLPVDPGEHELTVKAPARRTWSQRTLVTGEGSRSSIQVPALIVEEPGMASSAGGAPGTMGVLAVVAGGLGLVGLGVGTAFGIDAGVKKSGYQQHQSNGRCIDQECVTLSQDAVASATVSTVGIVAGAALAATGLVLWLAAPGRDSDGRAVAVMPMAGPQTAGMGISGSW